MGARGEAPAAERGAGAGGGDAAHAAKATARSVVVCFDDLGAARPWASALEREGLEVHLLAPGEVERGAPSDAGVLHVHSSLAGQLPRLRALREAHPRTPLMAAVRGLRELDQVLALEMGADDAVDASVGAPVVAARLRALWRRSLLVVEAEPANELRFGRLQLLRMQRQARSGAMLLPLTEGEFEVLWLLASRPGRPIPRHEILRRVHGAEGEAMERAIDSRIYRIRSKLEEAGHGRCIATVRHHGYVFAPQEAS
jgi:DNA-binding response OmpR family regulator